MPFGIVAFAFMLFSWTTFLETAVCKGRVTITRKNKVEKKKKTKDKVDKEKEEEEGSGGKGTS